MVSKPVSQTIVVSDESGQYRAAVTSDNALKVSPVAGGTPQDTNLTQVGGAAVSLGLKPRDTSIPMVIADLNAGEYETVAAGQTAQVLGATGATGDYLSGLLVTPATTSPGNVIILDSATSITVFTGGASSVSNLVSFFIPIGAYSVSGAWKVTTGSNVSVLATGNFT